MKLASLRPARALIVAASLLVASLPLAGCSVASDTGEEVAATQQADESENGLAMNGLAMNGLAMNGLAMNGLAMNSLTVSGIARTSAIRSALERDPLARMFFSYVVNCALPAGQSVVLPRFAGQIGYTFPGGVGVAPEWGESAGSCDTDCQRWVSACVIARVNALGVHVPLSIRGNNAALATTAAERSAYPHREATYFGNVFSSPHVLHACRAAGDDQTLIGRTCGDGSNVSGCLIDVLGDCNTTCTSKDRLDGFFAGCTTPSHGTFMQTVTVYRQ